MDPVSIMVAVIGVLDSSSKGCKLASQCLQDYKHADKEIDAAWRHASLLQEQINGLDSLIKTIDSRSDNLINESSLEHALPTAQRILSEIEANFPSCSGARTWREKVKWALSEKKRLEQERIRLLSVESTLNGILSIGQLRLIRDVLEQQQMIVESIGLFREQLSTLTMSAKSQSEPILVTPRPTAQPAKLLPLTAPVSGLGKIYALHMRGSSLFSFYPSLHVANVVSDNSAIAAACRRGRICQARALLENKAAHGNDITASGWSMLHYAIQRGSAKLVRLLLSHGADPNMTYGGGNMTALQAAFLHYQHKIAQILIKNGANIDHLDTDGYSVLSYLWIVEKSPRGAGKFMRLLSGSFSKVNACDSRGWNAFHRAAAVGTVEDVRSFLRLGASLDLRTEWYGWTALFYAASHDNLETFQAIAELSGDGVYNSLDGDGWNLLHCCVYFGAPRVMRLVLQQGIDVNSKTLRSPMAEDPKLKDKELTAADLARYIGPKRYRMFLDALIDTKRCADLEDMDVFWDAAEDVDDTPYEAIDWKLLHWASYNGSPRVKSLFLLKGADPEHLDAVMLEDWTPELLVDGG